MRPIWCLTRLTCLVSNTCECHIKMYLVFDTDVFGVWYMFNDSHVFDVWCVSVSRWDVFGVWHMFSDYHVSGVWCVSLCWCWTLTLNGGHLLQKTEGEGWKKKEEVVSFLERESVLLQLTIMKAYSIITTHPLSLFGCFYYQYCIT